MFKAFANRYIVEIVVFILPCSISKICEYSILAIKASFSIDNALDFLIDRRFSPKAFRYPLLRDLFTLQTA